MGEPFESVPVPQLLTRASAWRELRAVRDLATTWTRRRDLRQAPRGQGQPVLLVPGFRTSDRAMAVHRRYLEKLGFVVRGWGLGTNQGNVKALLPRLSEQVDQFCQAVGSPVALVGVSLGGVLAREVARDRPEQVRRVITLGTPVVGGPKYTVAASTFIRRGYDLDAIAAEAEARSRTPFAMPVTAVLSPDDGVVHWAACFDRNDPKVEHVQIRSTHVGLLFHADARIIMAERLARDPA